VLLLLLSCSPKVQTIALPAVAACRTDVLTQALPGLWVKDVHVLEGEIPVRVRHSEIDLQLEASTRNQDSVLLEYSAGPFQVRRRARIQVPRSPRPMLLPAEPPSWRLRFEGAQLGIQAMNKSNILGMERDVELLLEICPDQGPCQTLSPKSSLWGSAPALAEPTFRLRDQDLFSKQRLTPKADARIQPGPNTLVLGDSTAQLKVQAIPHPTQAPEPLLLDQPVQGMLSRQGNYPHAYVLHLDKPQSLSLATTGAQDNLTLGLHHCDGTLIQSVRNEERRSAVIRVSLEPGDWLIRAGLPRTGVVQENYELLATTDSQALEDFVRGKGSN
jgi:hypothetical protein